MFKLSTCIVIEFAYGNYRITLHVPYNVVMNNITFNKLAVIRLASVAALLTAWPSINLFLLSCYIVRAPRFHTHCLIKTYYI